MKVHGRRSRYIQYRRSADTIEKVYVNFSDDGRDVYAGREAMRSNPRGNSTYSAELRVKGRDEGGMNLVMTFGPLGGDNPARLIFDKDASGKSLSHGYAEFNGKRLTVDTLIP